EGMQRGRDGGPQRKAALRQQMDEDNSGCEVDADDDQRDPQRRDDVLQCIKDPDQEGRRRLSGQPKAEERQRERRLAYGIRAELPALEEGGRDRYAEQGKPDRSRRQDKDVEP